jgi:hypothetical protein
LSGTDRFSPSSWQAELQAWPCRAIVLILAKQMQSPCAAYTNPTLSQNAVQHAGDTSLEWLLCAYQYHLSNMQLPMPVLSTLHKAQAKTGGLCSTACIINEHLPHFNFYIHFRCSHASMERAAFQHSGSGRCEPPTNPATL